MNNQTLKITNQDEIIDQVVSELMQADKKKEQADKKKEVETGLATEKEIEKVMEYINV